MSFVITLPKIQVCIDSFNIQLYMHLEDRNFTPPAFDTFYKEDFDLVVPQGHPTNGDDFTTADEKYGDDIIQYTNPRLEEDDVGDNVYDKLIGAQLIFDYGSNSGGNLATQPINVTDKWHVTTFDGTPVGKYHKNLLLGNQ